MAVFVFSLCSFVAFTLLGNVHVSADFEKSKRILVSDPNVMLQQLSELQTKMTQMEAKLTIQQQNNEAQDKLIKAQEATLNQMAQQFASLSKVGGSVYIRWGHHHCPGNKTEELYSGFAAGGWYNSAGTSPNYLCLPPDPQWSRYDNTTNGYVPQAFGVEYDSNFFGTDRYDKDVPCAVCRTERTATFMTPARQDCYPGWTKEYNGYLAATDRNYKASSDYVCVDDAAEMLIHSQANDNGLILRPVETVCGSLSCPPYVNYRELTCALCSK